MDNKKLEEILYELDHEARSNAFKSSELVNDALRKILELLGGEG